MQRSKQHLIQAVTAEIYRASGRHYQIELETLDERSLRQFHTLLRDLDHETRMRAQRAQRMPWRQP